MMLHTAYSSPIKVFCLVGSIIIGSSCANFGEHIDDEILYKVKDGSLVQVFNLRAGWESTQDVSYLERRDQNYGEFKGQTRDCSNDEFYCLAGGINVAIPKLIDGQTLWEYNDRICSAKFGLSKSNPNQITCRNMHYELVFTYDVKMGITSFNGTNREETQYTLISDRGLFSGVEALADSR